MSLLPLDLTLAAEARPGRFMLTGGAISYPIERPVTDVALDDLLRRLSVVLVGGADPAGQLDPSALLREVGTRLWQVIVPDSAPAADREALAGELRKGGTPPRPP